ncbi:MAG: DUF434 domain-containing protein [Ignavibacteriales bacterium]
MVNKEKVITASRDYLYLKKRGYSIRSILEIVGNRYQLNTEERNVLYRGFFIKGEIKSRKNKILGEKQIKGEVLKIDGYNQLITIESYRKGNFVFIAVDGVVRDSASVHRSYKPSPFTEEVLNRLLENIGSLELEGIEFYFDRPVSFSGELCKMINGLIAKHGLYGKAETVDSPDYILKRADLVATSDSIIIAGAKNTFDLAGWLIHRVWKAKLVDLRTY